jgi:hypothetical protein
MHQTIRSSTLAPPKDMVAAAMLIDRAENGNTSAVICRNLTPASPIFSRKFAGRVKFQWKAVIA